MELLKLLQEAELREQNSLMEKAVFIGILLGKVPSERQQKKMIMIISRAENKVMLYKELYKYIFKKDISHITDKYEKKFGCLKMLNEIAKYHFNN